MEKKTWYNCPKETIAFPHLWKRLPSSQRLNRLVAIVTNKGEGHLSSAARARQGQRQALFLDNNVFFWGKCIPSDYLSQLWQLWMKMAHLLMMYVLKMVISTAMWLYQRVTIIGMSNNGIHKETIVGFFPNTVMIMVSLQQWWWDNSGENLG